MAYDYIPDIMRKSIPGRFIAAAMQNAKRIGTQRAFIFTAADFVGGEWQPVIEDLSNKPVRSFIGLKGVLKMLPQLKFAAFMAELQAVLPVGSSVAFDYPLQPEYCYEELENLLAEKGWLIYEHRLEYGYGMCLAVKHRES